MLWLYARQGWVVLNEIPSVKIPFSNRLKGQYSIFVQNHQAIRKTGIDLQFSSCGFLIIE